MPAHSDTKPTLFTHQHFSDSKRQRVVLTCLLLGALVFLIIGLRNLSFQPPAQFNFVQQESNADRLLDLLEGRVVFIVVAFVLMLVVLALLISRVNRTGTIILLAGLILIIFIFYLSSTDTTKKTVEPAQGIGTPVTEQIVPSTAQADGEVSVVEFDPPQFSDWLLLFFSFVAVMFFVLIIWLLFLWRRSDLHVVTHIEPLEEIGEAVRLALDELETGVGERDTVIHCYVRMNEIVMRSIHVERGASRTASEFAARLEALGLPGESTRRLTRLFEMARYGAYTSQVWDIQEAKDCLEEITRYCGEPV